MCFEFVSNNIRRSSFSDIFIDYSCLLWCLNLFPFIYIEDLLYLFINEISNQCSRLSNINLWNVIDFWYTLTFSLKVDKLTCWMFRFLQIFFSRLVALFLIVVQRVFFSTTFLLPPVLWACQHKVIGFDKFNELIFQFQFWKFLGVWFSLQVAPTERYVFEFLQLDFWC